MKPIEDAFSSETFRRIVLPGIVLAAGAHPLIAAWVPFISSIYGVGLTVLLITEIFFLGLIVSSAVNWIYYVYEGFRLQWLTELAGRANKRRVRELNELRRSLMAVSNRSPVEDSQLSKTYESLLDFPVRRLSGGSEYFCERPTRLGNIIAGYELYPETRYGVDGIFYWFHLLNLAPETARREFSDQYAFAESLVLTSFSGVLVAVLHTLVLIGFGVGNWSKHFVFAVLQIEPRTSLILLVFGFAVWMMFYLAALQAHREVGKVFQSIVDIAMPPFVKWLHEVEAPLGDAANQKLTKVTKYLAEPSNP